MKGIIFNLMMINLFLIVLLVFGFLYLVDKIPFDITRKTFDPWFKFVEHWSSKMNSWSWQKRWGDRKKGTGYKDERDTL